MFAGIGGFRAGLTRAGGFQCVGHCEIDKYTNASYCAIHDIGEEEQYYPDARTIDPTDLPKGCKFSPRCPKCMDICKETPPKEYVDGTHCIACHLFGGKA